MNRPCNEKDTRCSDLTNRFVTPVLPVLLHLRKSLFNHGSDEFNFLSNLGVFESTRETILKMGLRDKRTRIEGTTHGLRGFGIMPMIRPNFTNHDIDYKC